MSEIKKYLEKELDELIPQEMDSVLEMNVLDRIKQNEAPSFMSFTAVEWRDNLILFLGLALFSLVVYFLGFQKTIPIKCTFSNDFLMAFTTKGVAAMTIIVILINEYFDSKKKIILIN